VDPDAIDLVVRASSSGLEALSATLVSVSLFCELSLSKFITATAAAAVTAASTAALAAAAARDALTVA
jgi:hypothetical protein